jgi:hypothetical protein
MHDNSRHQNKRRTTRKRFLTDLQRQILIAECASKKRMKGEGETPQPIRNAKCLLNQEINSDLIPFLLDHLEDWQLINVGLSGTDKLGELQSKVGQELPAIAFFLRTWLSDEDVGKLILLLLLARIEHLNKVGKSGEYVNPKTVLPVIRDYLDKLDLSEIYSSNKIQRVISGELPPESMESDDVYSMQDLEANEGQRQAIRGIDLALAAIGERDVSTNLGIWQSKYRLRNPMVPDTSISISRSDIPSEDCLWIMHEQKRYRQILKQSQAISLPGIDRPVNLELAYSINAPSHIMWAFIEANQDEPDTMRFIPRKTLLFRDLIDSLISELKRTRFALVKRPKGLTSTDDSLRTLAVSPWKIGLDMTLDTAHYATAVREIRRRCATDNELLEFWGSFDYERFASKNMPDADEVLRARMLVGINEEVYGPVSPDTIIASIRKIKTGGIRTKYYETLTAMEERGLIRLNDEKATLTEKGNKVASEGGFFAFKRNDMSYSLSFIDNPRSRTTFDAKWNFSGY